MDNVTYGLFCACQGCKSSNPGWIRYVGQTMTGLKQRFRGHVRTARKPPNTRPELSDLPVYRWMAKHGVDNIRYILLDECEDPKELDKLERYWIKKLGTFTESWGLNLSAGGIGLQGYRHTDESREKMRSRFSTHESRMKSSMPGELHPRATFRESEVLSIKSRLWNGERASDIADELAVPIHRIQQINVNVSWSEVPWPIGPRVKPRRRSVFNRQQREDVQRRLYEGESMHSIARLYGVSVSSVFRLAHPPVN